MHFQSLSKLCSSAWRQLYICACIHNCHREWLDYPIRRQEKQTAENSCFRIFFCSKVKAGALRKAFNFVSVAKTQSYGNPGLISAWGRTRRNTHLNNSDASRWTELWGMNCNKTYLLALLSPTQPSWPSAPQPLPPLSPLLASPPPDHSFHCYPHDCCPHHYKRLLLPWSPTPSSFTSPRLPLSTLFCPFYHWRACHIPDDAINASFHDHCYNILFYWLSAHEFAYSDPITMMQNIP